MGLFIYGSIHTKHNSTQEYLGSVRMCPSCNGQKPKETFRMVDGQSICQDCQDELQQEEEDL